MTIRVLITNLPNQTEEIKIEVQSRDQGRFSAAEEVILEPGQSAEFLVHPTQSLQIIDPKDPE